MLIFSLILASTAGLIIVSYEHLANKQGWPVGSGFRSNKFLLIIGGLSIFGSFIFAVTQVSFLWAIGVLILGWILAFILSFTLKSWVQLLSLILLVIAWILQFFSN